MEEKMKLSKDITAPLVDATSYRSIVGALRYLTHTWLDIGFAMGYVRRFMVEPRITLPQSSICSAMWQERADTGSSTQGRAEKHWSWSALATATWWATLMGGEARRACSSSLERARSPGRQ